MYDVLDVCRYIVHYCNEHGIALSNLKLQKLLYFIQAYFLCTTGSACFKENIEAWGLGPVVPKAYHEYKQYGSGEIPYVFPDPLYNRENIYEIDKKRINKVLDRMAKYSAMYLVQITHCAGPWKDVYVPNKKNIVIDNAAIKAYFSQK